MAGKEDKIDLELPAIPNLIEFISRASIRHLLDLLQPLLFSSLPTILFLLVFFL